MMKWISIKDKLPEYKKGEEQIFIVAGIDPYDSNKYVHWAEAYAYGYTADSDRIFSIPGWRRMGVTHYMPLPNHPDKCSPDPK